MNSITVELDDYITDDDKRALCREAFHAAVVTRTNKDFERIVSNALHDFASREVDAVMDGKLTELVRERGEKVIRDLSPYTVFAKPDAWGREANKGWTLLQQAMDDAAPLIRSRVAEMINGMEADYLRELIENQIGLVILARLQERTA